MRAVDGARIGIPEDAESILFHGVNVACHRHEWPATRAVMVAAMERWGERGMAEVARHAHENIERLDAVYGRPVEE